MKRYYSLSDYCKETFGEKLYKIALDAGMTCPNRDGTKGSRGCIFCSAGGSGEFAAHKKPCVMKSPSPNIAFQIESGKAQSAGKFRGRRYIAYFQAYTNTYAPPARLYALYTQALSHPDIAGISIATRPDCLGREVLAVLDRCRSEYPGKFVWIELGLQTVHEKTARYIRRGYPLSVFDRAVFALHTLGIPVIVHIILGLPGETQEQMLETVCYVNSVHPSGVKLQLLHVLKGTDLEADYASHRFEVMTQDAYIETVARALTLLSPGIVIHRLTGDGPKRLLIAPLWSADKKNVLNSLTRYLDEHQITQGSRCISLPGE